MGKKGMVRNAVALCLLVAVGSGCDYGALKKRNAALEAAVNGLQSEKEAQQRELADLKSTNDQLAAQLSTSQGRASGLAKENDRLSQQFVELSHKNAAFRQRAQKAVAKRPEPARSRTVARGRAAPFRVDGATVAEEPGRIKVRLSNSLLFGSGKAVLRKQSLGTLAQVARIIKARYPKSVVGIEGHTDATPIVRAKKRFRDNHDLSVQRARAVFDYLKTHSGIPESRLFVAGYGPIRPEGPNKTRQGRAQNRRVEIVVYTQ